MIKKYLPLILMCSMIFIGCKTQLNSTSYQTGAPQKINSTQDLTSRLKNFAGVQIQGNGANASIIIRGISSFMLSNEPLFILNGVQFSGNYSDLYNSISSYNIKKIEVLKDGGSLAMYGSSGANGVIKITTIN